jgi:hypothetical protein
MTQLRTVPSIDRRAHLLALLLGVPAIVTALGVTALETWRWISPHSTLFVPPAAATLADAIAANDPRAAYEFIRAGQDPNGTIAVRHDVLTGGRPVEISPLLWAVATQSEEAVAMLLGFGARLDASAKHEADCLAMRFGRDDIVHLLELLGADDSSEPCPAASASGEGAALFLPTR